MTQQELRRHLPSGERKKGSKSNTDPVQKQ
jgi:hypothetical protein